MRGAIAATGALDDDRPGHDDARSEHAFLHDADAFFLEADGLERQYRECRDRGMYTLGVTARWDPFFEQVGYTIPGTWEMMYSTRWARVGGPADLEGAWRPTPHGPRVRHHALPPVSGLSVGDDRYHDPSPRLVHFPRNDHHLSILRIGRAVGGRRAVSSAPPGAPGGSYSLARRGGSCRRSTSWSEAWTDPISRSRTILREATREYPELPWTNRRALHRTDLRGLGAERIRELIRPFDKHFERSVGRDRLGAASKSPGACESESGGTAWDDRGGVA